ncbi:ATP synthase subunit delta [Buchnera aphidicola (Tetraneura ulmi)]|uniref:ATP synthase F1 subunit delta n=1 Tax=Buchnera aphidicola TaxID=9 RepID=UPI003464B816
MLQNRITIARNYAKAVLNIAIKDGSIEYWEYVLDLFSKVIELDIVKKKIFSSKSYILKIFSSVLNNKIDRKVRNLISIIIDNNRLLLLPEILKQFSILKNLKDNVIEIFLISVCRIESFFLDKITKKLVKCYPFYKILVKQKIDKSIIGGLVLIVNSKKIDFSISSQIRQINNFLNSEEKVTNES